MDVDDASAMARRPVSQEPIKVIILGILLVFNTLATVLGGPLTKLITPAGRPIFSQIVPI